LAPLISTRAPRALPALIPVERSASHIVVNE